MSTLLTPRQTTPPVRRPVRWNAWQITLVCFFFLIMGAAAVAFPVLTWVNFSPLFKARPAEADANKVRLPELNYAAWHDLPVLHGGRIKPFETACQEMVRQITGANRFQKLDSVGVVLAWMMQHDAEGKEGRPWDDVRFISCGHEGVRTLMFRLNEDGTLKDQEPDHDFLETHFASPNELRKLRQSLLKLRERDPDLWDRVYQPVEDKEREAAGRLFVYDQIVQNLPPMTDDGEYRDPLAFVALDKVTGSPWFSLAELRRLVRDPRDWEKLMKERVEKTPQLYLPQEQQQVLEAFKEQLKRGDGGRAIDELVGILDRHREENVSRFTKLRGSDQDAAKELFTRLALSAISSETDPPKSEELRNDAAEALEKNDTARMARWLDTAVRDRDQRVLAQLRERLPRGSDYQPHDPRFRMLHLGYLETRYPDLYEESARWQKFDKDDAAAVLGAFVKLQEAYAAGDAGRFDKASERFFATVETVSAKAGAYPGGDTVGDRVTALLTGEAVRPPSESLLQLELLFNRVTPFRWAWVAMLAALLFFLLSLGLNSRLCYGLAFAAFGVSLAFQLFGFAVRMLISGRPPVTNMYETVVWVALMSAVFALVLEVLYRRKVIALAGAAVATLALVLADTLPLALDPKISPLNPVLRSNFWLTIHVITEVSSYAAGTLAWGLGNISLTMIVFGKGSRETVKTLGQFTYRALQIAVLLLAAGTFLGGWWAAYSWGRFWGWDPKETGALIALVCYVIPLHMRYVGWVKDFGLAVAAIVCYIAVLFSWYGVNFLLGAGLHSYGFGGGGASWVFWAISLNMMYLGVATMIYRKNLTWLYPPQPRLT
jgi:ABC-type transport system involved in cytochrome c biogenesis permease subunit